MLVRDISGQDQYHAFVHSLSIFNLAFTRNLWVSSLEEFMKGRYFEKQDIV